MALKTVQSVKVDQSIKSETCINAPRFYSNLINRYYSQDSIAINQYTPLMAQLNSF